MDEIARMQGLTQALGLELPSPAYFVGAIVFGLIGLIAFRRGRKAGRPRVWAMGLALMLYPYLISRTWMLYLVGLALCGGLALERYLKSE